MRVAYLLPDGGIRLFGNKGAAVHVREMVRALGAEHEVDLFCAALGEGRYDLPIRSLDVVPLPSSVDSGDPTMEKDLARLDMVARMKELVDQSCWQRGYDMIYERYSLFSDVGASVADTHAVPFLLEVNAPLIAERRRAEPLPLAPLAREVEGRVLRRADAVLAVSDAVAAYVVGAGGRKDRVHVIPNAVDTARFHPGISSDLIRSRLGVQGRRVVGFAGSLRPWHGVDLVLEAFASVAGDGWSLLIVGHGHERDRLEARAEALGVRARAIFTGAVPHDEMPLYLAAMDIAVAPYRYAADFYFSPLKLYEYLAMGKPVVASDVGQIATVIRHGENGWLVPPDDVAALARALARLGADEQLRHDLAHRAPGGLRTWQETARQVISIAQGLQRTGQRDEESLASARRSRDLEIGSL